LFILHRTSSCKTASHSVSCCFLCTMLRYCKSRSNSIRENR